MDTLNGAILNLAGPGQKIAGVMPCTVIRPGDMADQILDRDKHPTWQGERTKLVYSFPTNEKLWDRYAQIRADSFRNDGDGREATDFYREHREEMDAGAIVAWPQRHNTDELSALQHAMNLKLQDERAFWAEYQNEPLPEDEGDTEQLTAEQVAGKTNGHARDEIPIGFTPWSPGKTISPGTWSITEPIPTNGGRTLRCGTSRRRSAGPHREPVWKVRSTPGWRNSPAITSHANGDVMTERC